MLVAMMTKKQIIGAIMAATGESVEVVARQHNYSKFAFYYVINGRCKTPKIREIIASIIQKPVNEIWPEPAEEGEA